MAGKRGQKVCKSCQGINGVRSFNCKHCGAAFDSKSKQITVAKQVMQEDRETLAALAKTKNKRVKRVKRVKQFEEIADWRTLERGDRVKVVGRSGNYYTGEDGERRYLIDPGTYTVYQHDENGLIVYDGGFGYIYMGPEQESVVGPSVRRSPHKLYKVNTPIRPSRV